MPGAWFDSWIHFLTSVLVAFGDDPLHPAVICSVLGVTEEHKDYRFLGDDAMFPYFRNAWNDSEYSFCVSLRGFGKVPRVLFVLGSHQFGVCREEYRKIGFFRCYIAALVSTTAVGMLCAGFAGDDALRAVFPSIVLRPRCSASWPV